MIEEPMVACVMLVDGRPEMVRRAIASFRAQTYERKKLLVYDTSDDPTDELMAPIWELLEDDEVVESNRLDHHGNRKTIGYLRNRANAAVPDYDAIAHFDSDDWSHPDRLALEVAALVVSGCEAVGFHDVLFWDTQRSAQDVDVHHEGASLRYHESRCFGQCWQYTAQHPDGVIGASLLYWRSVWEKHPFPDRKTGEDTLWLMRRNVYALPSVVEPEPRMVCEIHGGNTASQVAAGHKEWRRASQWDKYCNEVMKL